MMTAKNPQAPIERGSKIASANPLLWQGQSDDTTGRVIKVAVSLSCQIRCFAFWYSDGFTSNMFRTNVCGFRSYSGKRLDCTWTMTRCPGENTWFTVGSP